MVSDDKAKAIHAAEVERQTAPDKKCGRIFRGVPCPQIVKIGTICPACGEKVT